jgi:hypothetical protein
VEVVVTDSPKKPAPLDDVFRAVDPVLKAAAKVTRTAPEHGPFGSGRPARSVGVSALVLLVLFFAARLMLEWTTLPTAVRVVIALLPLMAFVWFLWAFIRQITEADELERRIQLEALAVAFPSTLILVMTLGLLQLAIPLSPDDWSYRHIWPFLYVFYLVGLTRARRRYA